jgi:hypothetical protein
MAHATRCSLKNVYLWSTGTPPNIAGVGILMGRNASVDKGNYNVIENVSVYGKYKYGCVAIIGCELNTFRNCWFCNIYGEAVGETPVNDDEANCVVGDSKNYLGLRSPQFSNAILAGCTNSQNAFHDCWLMARADKGIGGRLAWLRGDSSGWHFSKCFGAAGNIGDSKSGIAYFHLESLYDGSSNSIPRNCTIEDFQTDGKLGSLSQYGIYITCTDTRTGNPAVSSLLGMVGLNVSNSYFWTQREQVYATHDVFEFNWRSTYGQAGVIGYDFDKNGDPVTPVDWGDVGGRRPVMRFDEDLFHANITFGEYLVCYQDTCYLTDHPTILLPTHSLIVDGTATSVTVQAPKRAYIDLDTIVGCFFDCTSEAGSTRRLYVNDQTTGQGSINAKAKDMTGYADWADGDLLVHKSTEGPVQLVYRDDTDIRAITLRETALDAGASISINVMDPPFEGDLQAAIDYVATEFGAGTILLPQTKLTLTAPINLGNETETGGLDRSGITLRGQGWKMHSDGEKFDGSVLEFDFSATAEYAGKPCIEMISVTRCAFYDFAIQALQPNMPSTAILQCRDIETTGRQCGNHIFRNVGVRGYYSKANMILLGSEASLYDAIYLSGGTAGCDNLLISKYNVWGVTAQNYTVPTDNSSCVDNTFHRCNFGVYGCSGIENNVQLGPAVETTEFNSCYFSNKTRAGQEANPNDGGATAILITPGPTYAMRDIYSNSTTAYRVSMIGIHGSLFETGEPKTASESNTGQIPSRLTTV